MSKHDKSGKSPVGSKRVYYAAQAHSTASGLGADASLGSIGQLFNVSPSLVAEIQTWTFPAIIVVAALCAKKLYLDQILEVDQSFSFYLGAGVLAAIVWRPVAAMTDLHATKNIVSGKIQFKEIALTNSLCFLLILALFYLLKMSNEISRGWFITWYVLSFSFLAVGRFLLLSLVFPRDENSGGVTRIAVYGTSTLVDRVISQLGSRGGHVISGAFSDELTQLSAGQSLGGMQLLIGSVQRGECDVILLALPSADADAIRAAMMRLDMLPISVKLCPDAMTVPFVSASQSRDLVLVDVQQPPINVRGLIIKTVMDYLVGAALLVIFAPAMALIALAIKFDSKGPILFVQSRHGYNHRIIRVVKFRTMTVLEDGPHVKQATRGDSRVTRVGRFLRRTSLDELPQLFNVLRGELSLVGPRPHAVTHNEEYSRMLEHYASRHKVKPGITGLAQVNGCRGEIRTLDAMRERVDFDLHYIRNWSAWLDVKIFLKTAIVPFRNTNAY